MTEQLKQKLLTIEEVSAWTRIPVKTLRHYRYTGDEPIKSAVIGRRVMYRLSDVENYLEAAFA